MKNLFIFRHGQTDLNKNRLVQGVSDFPLNRTGIGQAEELASRMKGLGISHIFSSDLKRAYETAKIVGLKCRCSISTHKALREQNFGIVERQPTADVKKTYPKLFATLDNIHDERTNITSFPKGETRLDVFNRAADELRLLLEDTPHTNIGISTHGGVILSLMAVGFGKMTHIRNGDYVALRHNGQSFTSFEV